MLRLGSRAKDGNDHLIYNSKTGTLAFDVDGAGGAAATALAKLNPGTKLGASAFAIV